MAPRANWKGYLRLSLVSCPIALYPASSLSEKVSFNRINRKTGNRLKQQNVDSETGEVVPREDIARGYEVGKGQYPVTSLVSGGNADTESSSLSVPAFWSSDSVVTLKRNEVAIRAGCFRTHYFD